MQPQPHLPSLDRVVAKYRRDVHHLPTGAPPEALTALEGHLGRRLPPGLRQFLGQHNGATLFRGSVRLRSAADMALASEKTPQAVLFADGPGDTSWAWAREQGEPSRYAFGRWSDGALEPLHASFAGWLAGSIAVVESRVTNQADLDALRFEADPQDVHQLIRAGRRSLAAGRPDEAEALLRDATARDPDQVLAWQYLGDALAITDRTAARVAWLRAFRRTSLPLPWPGAGCLEPDVLRALSLAFSAPTSQRAGGEGRVEKWEDELARFLSDRVRDVVDDREAALAVAVGQHLASARVQRGQRARAREVLSDLLSRSHVFTWAQTPWSVLLQLARLEVGLGHHDEAEALLKRLDQDGPDDLKARGRLILAHIAVTRQEPWAEDILEEALGGMLTDAERLEATLVRIERGIRLDRVEAAGPLLDEARKLARRIGLTDSEAAVALAEGDVARARDQLNDAAEHYRRALALACEAGGAGPGTHAARPAGPEVALRARVRLGDLCRTADDLEGARALLREALSGYCQQGLPVREAWVLVRLAAITSPGRKRQRLLDDATERFVTADLATGIATVDSLRGDPGASLGWHLERATAQARARHDAQRARPPWTRADADRPERRLGAHRLAIAACGESVVTALANEMAACVRVTQAGRGRAKDPVVLRYVAAVDLLSGHRSYASAQVLLQHLLTEAVDGVAYRALQGAIARSPNAALVDGLLRCIERPAEVPAKSVAAAAELLGLRREAAAVKPLVRLAGPDRRKAARKAAVAALGRIGKRSAVDAVLEALDEPALAEAAALSLLMLGDRRGIDFHGRALLEGRTDLSGHPGELVGRYGGPDHFLLLVGAADGASDGALGALQGLGLMGDPRAVPVLLEALGTRDRRVVEVASGALELVTGHREDLDTPGIRNRWTQWWAANEDRFPEGVRHREGRLWAFGLLLERMEHVDAWTRRTAYDELVITSGCSLPFDVDGPWRIQQAHLRAWQAWWAVKRHETLAGRWFLDGRRIH